MWSKKRRKELRENARARENEGKPPEGSSKSASKPTMVSKTTFGETRLKEANENACVNSKSLNSNLNVLEFEI